MIGEGLSGNSCPVREDVTRYVELVGTGCPGR
jgi:hypothetical protein